MSSRFKKSLGLFKYRQAEDVYRILKEKEFEEKYVEIPSIDYLREKDLSNMQRNEILDLMALESFFMNIYAALRFGYEIDDILDQMEYEGINFENAEALLNMCGLLSVNSTNVMLYLGNGDFSKTKHYALCEDVITMVRSIYETMAIYHSVSDDKNITIRDTIEITNFDRIENRLSCRYIRSGLLIMKLFHVLAVLQKSPFYSDEIHSVSAKLIDKLREILFDKRIIKVVIDSDVNGENDKPHKSTRIKIYFAMGNSDRYCIRLDFPHEGEDSIHLNMNQPGIKQSIGFPFGVKEYKKFKDDYHGRVKLSDLFYFRDDLYWFKSGYTSALENIVDEDLKYKLEQFMHERAHIKISSADPENKKAVALFSCAFAEAMIEYEVIPNIYGKTDSEDELTFKYALLLDYIYDSVIKLRNHEIGNMLRVGEYCYKKESDIKNSLSKIIDVFREYLQEKFPRDHELLSYTNNCSDITDFFEKCLNYVEKIEKECI